MTQSIRPTTETCWHLKGQSGQLDIRDLKASVDLSAPHAGLGKLHAFGHATAGTVLGVQLETGERLSGARLADAYSRGRDLVAVYEQTDVRSFRATVYWRALDLAAGLHAAAVELIVSVQTDLLDTTPQLRAHSRIDATAAYAGAMSEAWESFSLSTLLQQPNGAAASPRCVALPLRGLDATYCEMIHPSDWRGVEVIRTEGGIELDWPLVGHFMEKGVVRRLRVRGVLLHGPPDEAQIGDLYREFAASSPPLTT
jgi:hypothetical protein